MNWRVYIRQRAAKQLKKFPTQDIQRIEAGIDDIGEDPFSGDIQKLSGENSWRRRVGSYRIFYQIRSPEKMIYIYEIERRTSKTY